VIQKVHTILGNQQGQTFVESLLYILLFSLVVAVFSIGLADAVGDKITDLKDRVNQIGTP
jgi:hypothetical protein